MARVGPAGNSFLKRGVMVGHQLTSTNVAAGKGGRHQSLIAERLSGCLRLSVHEKAGTPDVATADDPDLCAHGGSENALT